MSGNHFKSPLAMLRPREACKRAREGLSGKVRIKLGWGRVKIGQSRIMKRLNLS